MSRLIERKALSQLNRIQWLERDMDEADSDIAKIAADLASGLDSVGKKFDSVIRILVGILITLTSLLLSIVFNILVVK